jgi:hypothetical protein
MRATSDDGRQYLYAELLSPHFFLALTLTLFERHGGLSANLPILTTDLPIPDNFSTELGRPAFDATNNGDGLES